MKTIFLFLITGFEEIEALATVDVLRRAGLPVCTVSLTDERTVTGNHGIPVVADGLLRDRFRLGGDVGYPRRNFRFRQP